MASFLFVGCLGDGVTPPVDDDVDDDVGLVKTDTPFITWIDNGLGASISLSSTATQYSNDPLVKGVGVPGAVIKVYIDGVQSGVGSTGVGGDFGGAAGITVSMITLTEGVRKLYVTATQPGLAESDKSTEYTFTYDETAPKIASAVADSTSQTIKVTFNEAVDTSSTTLTNSALGPLNYELDGAALAATATLTKISTTVVLIDVSTSAPLPAAGNVYVLACKDIHDSIDNEMADDFTETYVGVVTD